MRILLEDDFESVTAPESNQVLATLMFSYPVNTLVRLTAGVEEPTQRLRAQTLVVEIVRLKLVGLQLSLKGIGCFRDYCCSLRLVMGSLGYGLAWLEDVCRRRYQRDELIIVVLGRHHRSVVHVANSQCPEPYDVFLVLAEVASQTLFPKSGPPPRSFRTP